jgi:hypothetical protein
LSKYNTIFEINRKIQDDYDTKKAKAFKVLRESLGYLARQTVGAEIRRGDPKGIWEKLEATYFGKESITDKATLLQQLSNIIIGDKENIQSYINRFNDLFDAVKNRENDGEYTNLDETWQLLLFYNGIERNFKRYHEYKDDIKYLKRQNCKYADVVRLLIEEEINRTKYNKSKKQNEEHDNVQLSYNTNNHMDDKAIKSNEIIESSYTNKSNTAAKKILALWRN